MSQLTRNQIADLLRSASRPMSAAEIAERMGASSVQIGSNLGYMRVSGLVISRRIATGKVRRYAKQIFSEMVRYWTVADRSRELRRLRVAPPRPRKPRPRTDDMRQMLEDLSACAHFQQIGSQSL